MSDHLQTNNASNVLTSEEMEIAMLTRRLIAEDLIVSSTRDISMVGYNGYDRSLPSLSLGDAMAVRTCAPATPFSGDQCAWMESTSDFNLFGVTLKLPYKVRYPSPSID